MNTKMIIKKGRILLVEDEAIIAMSTALALRERGYEVHHVLDGESALRRIASGEDGLDLVLMDIDLGKGMDGTEAARGILRIRSIPIVFLSAHSDRAFVERTESISYYGYVSKASGIALLDASIKMAFRLFEANAELARSEDRFSKAFELNPDCLSITRISDGVFVETNAGFTRILGYSRDEARNRASLPGDLGVWADAGDRARFIAEIEGRGAAEGFEAEFRRKDGSLVFGDMAGRVIEIGGERCVLSILQDVTERKRAERDRASLDRIKAAAGEASRLILREPDRIRLLEGACRIAVEEGGLRMAWIGLADEESGRIRPVASAGDAGGYLRGIEIDLYESLKGQGPTGTALREARAEACADIESDERMAPWRAKALAQGFRSSAAIPLLSGQRRLGVLSLYSGESGFFRDEVIEILERLARDVSFAIEARRTEELRSEAERKLIDSERLYRESFMQSAAVKLLVDPDSAAIVDANPAAADFYGHSVPVLREMKVSDLNIAGAEAVREIISCARSRVQNRFRVRHRLASGDIRDVEVFSSPIKIGGELLLHSIIQDITEQKKAEAALRESEARFRTAFEDAPVGMALADIGGRVLDANKAFCDMLGRPASELVSMEYPSFTHPDDIAPSREAVASCLSGRGDGARLVKRYLHGDGRPIWSDVSLSLLRDEGGEPRAFIIHALDIGERMQYEARLKQLVVQKETLMKELQHRVKNNLNVVSGLLSLESARCADERAGRSFENAIARVDSIAGIYEKLYDSEDQASVDLAPYVADLAGSLFSAYNLDPGRIRLRTELDSARLDTKRSVPFGLILNELVSNALKYAYPGEAEGEVRIELKAGGGRLTLAVSDDGPGLPEEHRASTSGSTGMMLVRMLTEQLDGTLGIDCTRGTRISVGFGS
jgi:PAS domain S-box-containing protein